MNLISSMYKTFTLNHKFTTYYQFIQSTTILTPQFSVKDRSQYAVVTTIILIQSVYEVVHHTIKM